MEISKETSKEPTIPKFLQNDQTLMSDECRSLLQTLPSEKGWVSPNIYLYRGFWYPPRLINSITAVQTNFQADQSDILLATNPKCGTTWLKALTFALLNHARYSSNNKNHPLLQKGPHDLVPFLETDLYVSNPNPDLSGFSTPRVFSTHIPYSSLPGSIKSSKCKIVYLCRNPKDTFISLWHFSNKMRPSGPNPLEEAVDMFCRGVIAYGPFWDHVLEYWKASQEMPQQVLFLKYEDIKEQPCEQLRRLADFLGCPLPEEQAQVEEIVNMCSFKNLSQLQVNRSETVTVGTGKYSFFRRGEVGDSVNYLTEEMIERFDRITEEKFRGTDLKL